MNNSLYEADIIFDDCVFYEDKIYYVSRFSGTLKSFDVKTHQTYVEHIPSKSMAIEIILTCGHIIAALEHDGNNLYLYDLEDKTERYISVDFGEKGWGNTVGMIEHRGELIIIPMYRSFLWTYNPETGEAKAHQLNTSTEKQKKGIKIGDEYWIFTDGSKDISIIDLDTYVERSESIDYLINYPMDVDFDGECVFVLLRNGDYISVDIASMKSKYAKNGFDTEFSRITKTQKNIILLPLRVNDQAWVIDDGNTRKTIDCYPDDFVYDNTLEWSLYMGKALFGSKVVYAQRMSNYCLVIDMASGEISWTKVEAISDLDISTIEVYRKMSKEQMIMEEEGMALSNFISALEI